MLKAADLARSTFFYQRRAMASVDEKGALEARIGALYDHHEGRYGYRRITTALRKGGEVVNHKTVQKRMAAMGLKSLVRPKKFRSYRGPEGLTAPNVLARAFRADRPNQKWVTDVTEFKIGDQKLYLSPIMDLYNGEIVAYQTDRRHVLAMVTSMLTKAFRRLAPGDTPLLHSDHGWLYRVPGYTGLLARKSVQQSMSRKGNCLDNAAMESFFGTLKSEFFHLNRFSSIEQLKHGIDRYIHYYNHERIKLRLGGLSPVEYRLRTCPPA